VPDTAPDAGELSELHAAKGTTASTQTVRMYRDLIDMTATMGAHDTPNALHVLVAQPKPPAGARDDRGPVPSDRSENDGDVGTSREDGKVRGEQSQSAWVDATEGDEKTFGQQCWQNVNG